MNNTKIQIKFDLAKEAREMSRQFFKSKPRGVRPHKNKKVYSRKTRNGKNQAYG